MKRALVLLALQALTSEDSANVVEQPSWLIDAP
jgi:hypothetical protein